MRYLKTSALLTLVLCCACAGGSKDGVDLTKPVTGEAARSAERAYKQGLEDKKDQNYGEATRYFEFVRNNFPYSQYAALSELGIADMHFDRDDFTTAATTYQDFVKAHPSHPRADYAAFRVGLAHYQDKPSDWFLLPPSYEKDQTPIKSALDALNRFTATYPKSDYLNKAKDLIAECRRRLAAHEQFVADFYWKRESWRGAASRELVLADSYGDLDNGRLHGEALWRAGVAYRNVHDGSAERMALLRLVQEAPMSPHRRDAETMLKSIPADPVKVQPAVKPASIDSAIKATPLTPAETPGAPQERPQADPGPGQAPSDSGVPERPESSPRPAGPITQEPKPGPTQQPPTPPLAAPDR